AIPLRLCVRLIRESAGANDFPVEHKALLQKFAAVDALVAWVGVVVRSFFLSLSFIFIYILFDAHYWGRCMVRNA
ncbi:hypothetical protein, partial [Flavobacterium sp. SaA2.13]|uniref:hypothetical protein n=1 Tax=Flavobacterium sp. SaA2.13 TaxID=2691898 RepID=UPI001CEF98F6